MTNLDTLKEDLKRSISIIDLVRSLNYTITNNKINSIYNTLEKTPSLVLYELTNTYYCFSTGKGGDIFNFYMDSQSVDFTTALKELQRLANTNIQAPKTTLKATNDTNTPPPQKEGGKLSGYSKDLMFEVFEYFISLLDLSGGGAGYLEGRGFDLVTCNLLRLKYFSKNDYSNISNKLKAKFDLELLKDSGLYNDKGNLICFMDCIVIPYLDKDYKPLYLQFRNIDNTGVKYIWLANDRSGLDKPIYLLDLNSDVLNNCTQKCNIWITEGVFDSLLIIQEIIIDSNKSINLSIALGSSNDIKRLELVLDTLIKSNKSGFKLNIIIGLDNDTAGIKATQTAVEIITKPKYIDTLEYSTFNFQGCKDINEYFLNVKNC